MFRRSLLLLPAVLVAAALPVAPAFAGEDDSASLHAPSRACVSGHRVKATVSSDDDVDTVAFYVDGKRLKRVTEPANTGRFVRRACASREKSSSSRSGSTSTLPASRSLVP